MKNKTLRSVILLALACLIVIPTLNCKKEPEEISVRLKWIPNATFAGDIIALEKGIFEKNGLTVTVNAGGFNLEPVRLVASGADHFGLAGPEQLMLAREQGLPLVAIAVVFQSSPVAFLAKPDAGIESPQDFVGHKVGIKTGTDVMMIYEALMKHEGIDRSKIDEIPIQFSLTPFIEGQIDVHPTYVNNEPILLNQQGVDHIIVDPKDYGVDLYGMCYFTTEKMIKENPKIVEKYLKSVIEAYEWSLENRDEAAEIIVAYNEKLNLDHQRKMLDVMENLMIEGTDGRIGWMVKEKWEATEEIFQGLGILSKPVDMDSVFTMEFLEKVYK